MTDSISSTNGNPMDGLTFCGPRSYSITAPSSIPSWLAINVLTIDKSASITLTPNDAALGGTAITVTV